MVNRFFGLVGILTSTFSLTQAQTLWGVVPRGGQDGLGTIFKLTDQFADLTPVKDFETALSAAKPENTVLCVASNGRMYGLSKNGGTFDRGVLFEFDPATNSSATKIEFHDEIGELPTGSLFAASNGKLYGCTSEGGANGEGVFFEYQPSTNAFRKLNDFSSGLGSFPFGGVVQGANGRLYGMTYRGGTNDAGAIFEFDLNTEAYEVVYSFEALSGGYPKGDLVQAPNGKFYGVTYAGGLTRDGVLFEFDPLTRVYSKKFDFNEGVGKAPECTLILASGDKLLGTAPSGGAFFFGTLFEFNIASGEFVKRHDFRSTSGSQPSGRLMRDPAGKIWGVAGFSGQFGAGVVFEFDPTTNSYFVRQSFELEQGSGISGGLVLHPNGRVFGIKSTGGLSGDGTIFEFNRTTNQISKRADLNLGPDGARPIGGLAQSSNGRLYGMTSKGGANGMGVIFSITPEGTDFRKEIDFDGSNGEEPSSGLLRASNGKLYGTVSRRGSNFGALIEFDPEKKELKVVSVFDGLWNGANPGGRLIEATNGKIYGTTKTGGVGARGVIFEYDPSNNLFKKVHEFGSEPSERPAAGLSESPAGKLYGVTSGGGLNNLGTIFEFDPATSQFERLYNFELDVCYHPVGTVVIHPNGKLYGASLYTFNGGGCVYEFDLATRQLVVRLNFNGQNGSVPNGDMFLGHDGTLIGSTSSGGAPDRGVLYQFNPANATLKTLEFNGTNGANPFELQLLKVSSRTAQTITFSTIPDKTVGQAPFSLDAVATSGLPVAFLSGSPDRITIDGNTVTLGSPGRARITARQDGNVSFMPAPSVVQEFCINPVKPTVTVTDNNPLTPVLSSSADAGNLWYRDGIALPDQTGKTLTIATTGTYSVEVRVDGCVSERSDNFPVVITSLENESGRLLITPNPVTHRSSILLPGAGEYDVRIFSSDGRVVSRFRTGEQQVELNHSNLSAGLYWVTATGDAHVWVAKFIKR